MNDISRLNSGYVAELYERYRRDPGSVDAVTREAFARWAPPEEGEVRGAQETPPATSTLTIDKIVGTVNLAQAIRGLGHLAAQLDPLGGAPRGDPSLSLAAHGLTEEDLRQLPASLVGGPIAERSRNALEAIRGLRAVYSSTTGYDDEHIHNPEERDWLRDSAEAGCFRSPRELIDFKALLMRLTQVEAFEQFLHRVFPGKTRFSIEGLDIMVPMLDEVIGLAADTDIHCILLGMAHRGRLNVLAHVLKRPYTQILAEFKDPVHMSESLEALGWTGDVKYHRGACRLMVSSETLDLRICMAPNPSHLEYVNPVVEGMARAAGTQVGRPGPPDFERTVSLPVLIHGDAAFPGQGVVAETLNLSRLHGYQTGGTIHLIANNQLGYTTPPEGGRSTTHASDLAKGFEIPIVHVNADDPEACIAAARMAFAYREKFQKDFLIDLIGYRRYGHNEGDEPTYTQPLMYRTIENHPTVRQIWADTLIQRKVIDKAWPGELTAKYNAELQKTLESLHPEEDLPEPNLVPAAPGIARRVKTAIPAQRLRALNAGLLRRPAGFTVHPKLRRAMERRTKAMDSLDEPTIDWSLAEDLAFASILEDGVAIRLTGQDVIRGTFSQRHDVLVDVETGQSYTPLQSLPQARAAFEIRNSPLSENAAVGFEYGYNVQAPDRLVLWEAQYGDFINGAQVILDEFIASARAKWGQTPSLVLLLPHAFEGQGPDHSSGRVERFLALAADINMRVVNCTTAAQYFHILRRQTILLKTDPLPLVIMTPKSLLRHPRVVSSLRDLSEGGWQPVIDDPQARLRPEPVRRLIFCAGKIYVDLVSSEFGADRQAIAIARMEQLYPFDTDEVRRVLDEYPHLKEVVWVQEEPENMGAWPYIEGKLRELIAGRWPLHYIGRPRSSSPAEGSYAWHAVNQQALVEQALDLKTVYEDNHVWLKRR